MADWLDSRISKVLADKAAEAGIRTLEPFQKPSLNLATNDYLDLANDPRVIAAGQEALARYGASSAGSPVVNGFLEIHRELEESLASWLGYPSALIWSSGYTANRNILSMLTEKGDLVLVEELMHISAIEGVLNSGARILRFPHNDIEALEQKLKAFAGRKTFVLTESLYSMNGDWPDLARIAELKSQYGFFWIVDEAHAIGWYGPGLCAECGVADAPDLLVTTLGKSLTSVGGMSFFMNPKLRDFFVNASREFMYTTYPAPACTAASIAAANIVQNELWPNNGEWRQKARDLRTMLGLDASWDSPIIPYIVGENADVVELGRRIADAGVRVGVIRPPSVPKGSARLRISINRNLCLDTFKQSVLPIIHEFTKEKNPMDQRLGNQSEYLAGACSKSFSSV